MTTKKQRFNKVEDVIEKTSQDGNDPFDYLEKTNVRQVMTPKKETKQIIDPKTDEVITPPSKNFDEAMLAFQKLSIAAVKDSKNPYFKNSYASLEEVMDAARQANQFGLYFAQPLQMIAMVIWSYVCATEITHAPTGEKRTSQCPVRVADTKIHKQWAVVLHMPNDIHCKQLLDLQLMMMLMKQLRNQKAKYNILTQTMKGHGNGL